MPFTEEAIRPILLGSLENWCSHEYTLENMEAFSCPVCLKIATEQTAGLLELIQNTIKEETRWGVESFLPTSADYGNIYGANDEQDANTIAAQYPTSLRAVKETRLVTQWGQ